MFWRIWTQNIISRESKITQTQLNFRVSTFLLNLFQHAINLFQLSINFVSTCFKFGSTLTSTSRSKSQVPNLNFFQLVSTFFQLISTSNLKINIFSQVVSTYSELDDWNHNSIFLPTESFFCRQINIKM